MPSPAVSSMRSSRSTNLQASCRASRVQTVVLPEPMNPARQRTCGRDGGRRKDGIWAIVYLQKIPSVSARDLSFSQRLVALQNADCTTVRGEFDFGQAATHSSKKALGEFRGDMPDAMRIRLKIGFGLIVDRAGGGLRFQVERVAS